jgi:hypothetical protein
LVKASGLNSRPSTPWRVNTGRKLTVITSSEKKIDGPTSCIARVMIPSRACGPPGRPARSQSPRCLWTFSVRITEASTMAPIASAMPPSDRMLIVSPCASIGMNDSSTATGRVRIGTRAVRTWRRKRKMTTATTIISSISVVRRVATDSSISPERS